MMLDDLTDASKRRIYLMARDMIDRHRRQTLADEAQLAQYIDDLTRQILVDQEREAAYAQIEIECLRRYFHILAVPCKTVRNEICEFILDNNDKSNEQVLEWLNSWWTRIAKKFL